MAAKVATAFTFLHPSGRIGSVFALPWLLAHSIRGGPRRYFFSILEAAPDQAVPSYFPGRFGVIAVVCSFLPLGFVIERAHHHADHRPVMGQVIGVMLLRANHPKAAASFACGSIRCRPRRAGGLDLPASDFRAGA